MSWTTIHRETGLVEHVCDKHGTGHPNYYSVYRLHNQLCGEFAEIPCSGACGGVEGRLDCTQCYGAGTEYKEEYDHGFDTCSWWVHGCCGCCGREDFPGHYMSDLEIVQRYSIQLNLYRLGHIDIKELRKWVAYTFHDLNVNERVKADKFQADLYKQES